MGGGIGPLRLVGPWIEYRVFIFFVVDENTISNEFNQQNNPQGIFMYKIMLKRIIIN